MTGAQFPMDRPDQWQKFWADKRDQFTLSPIPDPQTFMPRTQGGFFGIPIHGHRLIYVIDTSRSMRLSHIARGRTQPSEARSSDTRLHLAKRELQNSVKALDADAEFAVISFANKAMRWRNKLSKASDSRKTALSKRLRHLHADGGTNIYAALISALSLRSAGRGGDPGLHAEEIFLLSDGEPSVGDLTNPDTILEAIGEANRELQIRINTIYIGGGDSDFMRRLAKQNSGSYVAM